AVLSGPSHANVEVCFGITVPINRAHADSFPQVGLAEKRQVTVGVAETAKPVSSLPGRIDALWLVAAFHTLPGRAHLAEPTEVARLVSDIQVWCLHSPMVSARTRRRLNDAGR